MSEYLTLDGGNTFSCMKIINIAWEHYSSVSERSLFPVHSGEMLRDLLFRSSCSDHGPAGVSPLRHDLDFKAISSVSYVGELCWLQAFCLSICGEMGLILRRETHQFPGSKAVLMKLSTSRDLHNLHQKG